MREVARAGALLAAVAFTIAGCSAATSSPRSPYGLGSTASPADIARTDIDVAPDGSGLPPGRAEAVDGAQTFSRECLRCHGSFIKLDPERWAYATSIFDYVRRAMPPDRKVPLTSDEVYGLTAYLLNMNGEIGPRDILDKDTLTRVLMPRVKDFITGR
jgi:hypothetical protein